MSKFAQYYLTYRDDNLFAHLEWEKREDLLAGFLANEGGIQFADKPANEAEATDGSNDEPKKRIKIYRHKLYHLAVNERIIVMRIANVKIIPIEKDFKPESVEHYPSVFVIFDTRPGCRRVAIQKLSTSFSNTDQVAKILQKTLGDQMMSRHQIGLEMRAQRYPMDFYRLWRAQEHHTARLKFHLDPDALRDAMEASRVQGSKFKVQGGIYSITRSHIIKYRKHKDWLTFSENKKTFKKHYFDKFIRIILAEPQKAARLRSFFRGIYDGITYDIKKVK